MTWSYVKYIGKYIILSHHQIKNNLICAVLYALMITKTIECLIFVQAKLGIPFQINVRLIIFSALKYIKINSLLAFKFVF